MSKEHIMSMFKLVSALIKHNRTIFKTSNLSALLSWLKTVSENDYVIKECAP